MPVQQRDLKRREVLRFVDDDVIERPAAVDSVHPVMDEQKRRQIFREHGVFGESCGRLFRHPRRNGQSGQRALRKGRIGRPGAGSPAGLLRTAREQRPVEGERRIVRPCFPVRFEPLRRFLLALFADVRVAGFAELHLDPTLDAGQNSVLALHDGLVPILLVEPVADRLTLQQGPRPRLEVAFRHECKLVRIKRPADRLHEPDRAFEPARRVVIESRLVVAEREPAGVTFRFVGELRPIREDFQRPILERRLLDMADAELGKHGGNVVEKHPVRREDDHPLRPHLIAVPVKQEGEPMERYRRLAAAGDALNDDGRIFGGTDNAVLLGLNRRDDVAQLVVLVFAEPVQQKFVRHRRIAAVSVVRVDDPLQRTFADDEIALQVDEPFDRPVRRLVGDGTVSAGERIEQAGDGRSPVDDERLRRILAIDPEFPDIERPRALVIRLAEVEASEVRFFDGGRQVPPRIFADRIEHLLGQVVPEIAGHRLQLRQLVPDIPFGALQLLPFFLVGALHVHFRSLPF